ncbi:unnamed protein product [Cyprideis torosa]|uniref:Cdc23 domain-containing protein n=1 Tax=Cyprideis torosa TaxID=163714 RepID=A0A7R8WEP2_9CRUS|nr:unnamed protein product [Cyprideis torosa]CAG0896042.1 unnamed protein product [Cyprideis torosa]
MVSTSGVWASSPMESSTTSVSGAPQGTKNETTSFVSEVIDADFKTQELLKYDLLRSRVLLSDRRLVHGVRWVSQLITTLEVDIGAALKVGKPEALVPASFATLGAEYQPYLLATAYMDTGHYLQAAHAIEKANAKSSLCVFIRLFALYKAAEQHVLDETPIDPMDTNTGKCSAYGEYLSLLKEIRQLESRDSFILYLEALVRKRLEQNEEARKLLCRAVKLEPLNWNAWGELAKLTHSVDIFRSLNVPSQHWMSAFFHLQACVDLFLAADALKIAEFLEVQHHFKDSLFILAMKGLAFNIILSVPEGLEAFEKIRALDPYSLDYMDTLSNLIYCKEDRVALTVLAHSAHQIDRYRRETLCIVANFYSLRSDHEKALLYFRSLLKVDPSYTAAWTLMGHEYIEVKNSAAAVQCYRKATEMDPRDYRAWYGLGQAYELLKLYQYSLYFFQRAQVLRPNDSRMLMALSGAYERLDRLHDAKVSAMRAFNVGDLEGAALLTVAKLAEKEKDDVATANAYVKFLEQCQIPGTAQAELFPDEQAKGHLFLTKFYWARGEIDNAYTHALKATEFMTAREESKVLLNKITEAKELLRKNAEETGAKSESAVTPIVTNTRTVARTDTFALHRDSDGDVEMDLG